MDFIDKVLADKHLYALETLPILTIYDDNWFVRNDYDILSVGQRTHFINFFKPLGFVQKTGKILESSDLRIIFPTPNKNLALSNYSPDFIKPSQTNIYAVTPTMFAEAIFYHSLANNQQVDDKQALASCVKQLKALINKCPYNIEWLRDVSYRSPIESLCVSTFDELQQYQKQVVAEKFKRKKAL